MIAVAALMSVVFVAGVSIAVAPPMFAPRRPIPSRRRRVRIASALSIVAAVFVSSGWLAPSLVVGSGVFWASGRFGRRTSGSDDLERLEALASWTESVRDLLLAGEQPVGAIGSSVTACQPLIRPHVRRLAAGLGRQDPQVVFQRFADDLDDPIGDLVATGLSIAVRRGARTVPVLTALAEQTREHVDRRRLVEAERAPTRREVQALTVIMTGLVSGLFVFGRSEYLDAYDTPSGQVFLAVALGAYAALIVRVQRLAVFPRPSRFLTSTIRPDGGFR